MIFTPQEVVLVYTAHDDINAFKAGLSTHWHGHLQASIDYRANSHSAKICSMQPATSEGEEASRVEVEVQQQPVKAPIKS
jgi:hypothetical protein